VTEIQIKLLGKAIGDSANEGQLVEKINKMIKGLREMSSDEFTRRMIVIGFPGAVGIVAAIRTLKQETGISPERYKDLIDLEVAIRKIH